MKRIKDERIMKAVNKLTAPMYMVILALTVLVVIIKLFLKQPIQMYLLEISATILSVGFVIISFAINGLLFNKADDECLVEIKEKIKTIGFMVYFWIYVMGEFVMMLLYSDKILIIALYICVWFVPATILTIRYIKNGLFIWGGKKNKVKGMKRFKVTTAIGSLFVGIINGYPFLWKNGEWNPQGILWILGMSIGWGLPFYFIMKLFIGKSEKHADMEVSKAEKESDIHEK